MGVWVGLMAIWGYRTFQEELQGRATKVAEETTLQYVKGDDVRKWLKTEAYGVLSDFFEEWKESQDLVAGGPLNGG